MIEQLKHTGLLVLIWLTVGVPTMAAADVFSCDFEDPTQNAQWSLTVSGNPQYRKTLNNFWCIGEAGSFGPTSHQGMYIGLSDEDSLCRHINPTAQSIVASCPLPTLAAGTYTFTMDWRYKGIGGREGLYMCLFPDGVAINSAKAPSLTAEMRKYMIPLSADTVLGGVMTWQVATTQFTVPPAAAAQHWNIAIICFFKGGGVVALPSASIDNIRIFPSGECEAPTDITHDSEGGNVLLSWQGNADAYEVRHYNDNTGEWMVPDETHERIQLLPGVEEGMVSFYVRSRCGENYSEWVKYERFIFIRGNRCIEYLDLNKNTCAYGTFSSPGAQKGVIDYGYASADSRHTLHYLEGEIDSRTLDNEGHGLKTKPDGTLASVRLGNWLYGAEAEQLTYTYKVEDLSTSVLKLRYAIVLQKINHTAAEQPQFELKVLHNNKEIPSKCGLATFSAPNDETTDWEGWHTTDLTYWRDWTTVSVNLRQYVGETIKIILTTRDCSLSGHYGYAYFVLDCDAGDMSGLNCGKDNPTTDFLAPDGFDYAWYKQSEPNTIISSTQDFSIAPMDTTIYMVDLISKSNSKCYYTLTARGWPRLPHPDAKWEDAKHPCANNVKFTNLSCVYVQNMLTDRIGPSDEKVGSLLWDFGDGSERVYNNDKVVYHTYPEEGGQFKVTLYATVNGVGDACVDEKSFYVYLPPKEIKPVEESYVVCKSDYPYGYEWNKRLFFYPNNIDSTFALKSVFGCDSIVHLTLNWADKTESIVYDSICAGDVYRLGGQEMTSSGIYFVTLKKANACGCDSVVELHLNVIDHIELNVADTLLVCDGDSVLDIPYELSAQNVENVTLSFDAASQAHGVPAVIETKENTGHMVVALPNHPCQLHASLTAKANLSCEVPVRDIYIGVRYNASILEQNAALIAVLDSTVNGGYSFIGCQWYRDGEPVDGITQYVLRTNGGDSGHEFYALLTAPDGTQIATCPIVYTALTPVERVEWQKLEGEVWVYDILGCELNHANNIKELGNLPHGMYVIKSRNHAVKVVK